MMGSLRRPPDNAAARAPAPRPSSAAGPLAPFLLGAGDELGAKALVEAATVIIGRFSTFADGRATSSSNLAAANWNFRRPGWVGASF